VNPTKIKIFAERKPIRVIPGYETKPALSANVELTKPSTERNT